MHGLPTNIQLNRPLNEVYIYIIQHIVSAVDVSSACVYHSQAHQKYLSLLMEAVTGESEELRRVSHLAVRMATWFVWKPHKVFVSISLLLFVLCLNTLAQQEVDMRSECSSFLYLCNV